MRFPRVRWLMALIPVVFFGTQCTPLIGCVGFKDYTEGSHLGFSVGMSPASASEVIAMRQAVPTSSKFVGIDHITSAKNTQELHSMSGPIYRWIFGNERPNKFCVSDNFGSRYTYLTFRDNRLSTISDYIHITMP
jgi:hypothetical protein